MDIPPLVLLLTGLHGVPVHWHSPFGFTVDRVAWCTCSLTGLHAVPVHWQDCMLFLFINRFAWCTCSLTGLHDVPVHGQDCVLYLFIDKIACCTCSLTGLYLFIDRTACSSYSLTYSCGFTVNRASQLPYTLSTVMQMEIHWHGEVLWQENPHLLMESKLVWY